MAGSVNKVILVGNVGADPESRNLNNGGKVVNLRIATSETWRDKRSGERKEKTEWHTVVVWNEATAKFVEDYVSKGDKVYVEGTLQTRKWQDQSGADRYSTEVVVPAFGGAIQLLSSKDGGNGRDGDDDRSSRRGSGRGRDDGDDDRSSSRGRGRSRNEDDGDDDRGSRRGRSSGRSGGDDDSRSSSKGGGSRYDDLDDDIPF